MPTGQAWEKTASTPLSWDNVLKPRGRKSGKLSSHLLTRYCRVAKPFSFEDQLIPIFRNGRIEDVYWTFSYSAVNDESGKAAGVLVTCSETTDKVNLLNSIKEREDQLNFTIDAAELGTWDLNPATNKFIGNDRLKEWFGLDPEDEIELSLALDNIIEKDRKRVIAAIQAALAPGSNGLYNIQYTISNPVTKEERQVLAKGKATFNEKNIANRFSGTLQDISAQESSSRKIEESERRFRNMVMQSPIPMTIFRGEDFVIEMANATMFEISGRGRKARSLAGRPLKFFRN